MELARREFLVAGGLAAGAISAFGATMAPSAVHAAEAFAPVAIHDPVLPASRSIAKARAGVGTRLVALTGDRVRFWRSELSAHRAAISGCTTWADMVILRGLAAEQGLRLRAEAREGGLFAWMLA
ncbi:MAG: hypothetical protein KGL48_15750 [Sphingomonadales bacterium]|nr:hypothetical protein [Sphingomonadales bacterium]MDE2567295.1 hypothetical protein [Sphingomonadales bacterium]